MDMLQQPYTSVLLVAIVCFLLWLWWPSKYRQRNPARRHPGNRRRELDKLMHGHAYWGVSIRAKQCDAARPYTGKKFTFERAPALPLPGCKSRNCSCHYQGLVERRQAQRRRGMDRRQTLRLDAQHPDRRSGKDQRRGNIAWKDPASHVSSLSTGHE
jgi:hypothetical protein